MRNKQSVPDAQPTRETLFEAAVAGHGQQFARIARVYAGREADDLVQEMFLQIWRSLPRFRGECAIGTWCYRVALNTALSWRRKVGRRREQSSGELDQKPAGATPTERPQRTLLESFVESLTDADQAVLLMHLANQDAPEIAAALDMTEGAIRTRLSRLRTKLSHWGDQHA